MTMLTASRLRQILDYATETGAFKWKVSRGTAKAGSVAGFIADNGYRQIGIDGRKYYASRLAWMHIHGRWPKGQVDHKNTIRDDDRFENLRDTTPAGNSQNRRRAHRNNKTGFLGVSPDHGRFSANICIDGQQRYLGCFDTPEAAHAAYLEVKRRIHPGCTI